MHSAVELRQASTLGLRLHHARRVAGLTLKQLAERAGCSESLLSKIEHEHTQPSLSMLKRIAKALDSSVSQLTDESWQAEYPVLRSGQRHVRLLNQRAGILETEALALPDKNALLQGEIRHLAPGMVSYDEKHVGHVLLYVLEGQLDLQLNNVHYRLGVNDSVSFPASEGFQYQNPTDQYTRVLWVISPAQG